MKSIIKEAQLLYLLTFGMSLFISAILTPILRLVASKLNIIDHPHSDIKTHKTPTPYLGGLAIWSGWVISLLIIRLFTHFPTGTLRNLRGIIIGSAMIVILGLVDDILPKGLEFKEKFLMQIMAVMALILFDIRLHFISPYFIAVLFSLFWVIGISNAFNIIDVMDGLSSGLAFIASLSLLFIALPTEQIYVNFCAAALAGGCLGFLPFNLSKSKKIFMGDTGSLTIGFILAAISMGTSYTRANEIGLLAPILILAIPIYDTILVMYLRIRRGQSPFLGSKDHFALRLEISGLSRIQILIITYLSCTFLSIGAFMVTRLPLLWALVLFALIFSTAIILSRRISKIEINPVRDTKTEE